MDTLEETFLLDPNVIFLNHGSFGATPRPVFEVYQSWQRELERQPVAFLGRDFAGLMARARISLAEYLGAAADQVVYFPNPTTAVNMVARNLALAPGDEILTTDHEYGALERTWQYFCRKSGARYIRRQIPLPVTTAAEMVERFLQGVTARTRVIFVSHITSPTALIFPIAEICHRAREMGILTIVDGAHAPGQIPLNMSDLGADIYTGACHKWLCAPKGAAFLYARYEVQSWLDPLVISWGYQAERPSSSQFIDYHELQGTRDISAFLAVPAAIEFQAQHDWETVRQRCHTLASATRQRLNALTNLDPICPDSDTWFGQMFSARLPDWIDIEALRQWLTEKHRIEVPLPLWNGQKLMRVSFQGYNRPSDADTLLAALGEFLDSDANQNRFPTPR